MTEEEKQLQEKGFQFIDNNLDSTFDKIPDDLLDLWTIDDEEENLDDSEDKCDTFTYFMYAFVKDKQRQGIFEFDFDEDELFKLFDSFKVILGIAIISRTTDVQVKPIKMFDFDHYSNIQLGFC